MNKNTNMNRMTSGLQGKYIKKRSNNYLCSEDIHRYGGRCQSLFYRLNKFGKTMKTQFVSIWATFKNSLSPVKHETQLTTMNLKKRKEKSKQTNKMVIKPVMYTSVPKFQLKSQNWYKHPGTQIHFFFFFHFKFSQ